MPEIYVMIPKGAKGEKIVQGNGFEGNQCQAATAPYVAALGGTTVSDVMTPETQIEVKEKVKVG